MPPPYRIIICGDSIYLMAIEAGLAELPHLAVERVAPCMARDVEDIAFKQPNLVVIEADCGHGDLALALLDQGVMVAETHPNSNQVTLLTRHRYPIAELKDIVYLIEQVRE